MKSYMYVAGQSVLYALFFLYLSVIGVMGYMLVHVPSRNPMLTWGGYGLLLVAGIAYFLRIIGRRTRARTTSHIS